ncbi:MAG: SDR family NAD(P)-dependent oxidoreductase, partial [Thermodesulfovibrionales bacterium]|nr:SDR family NAD(P)-dependent oxidoreductase [Thermodesulfovibrionales bacterium]
MKLRGIDNVALVTGGSGGLGREIVTALAKNHFKVILNYFKNEPLVSLKDLSLHEEIIKVKADLRQYDQVQKMADLAEKLFRKVDLIINNAGVTKDSILLKLTEEDWDLVLDTNLKGTFNIIKAFIPLMEGGGHIINISSYSGVKGKRGQAAYSASKAAIIALTKVAALELARYDIKVNAIIPGYLPLGMGAKAQKAMEEAKELSILKRLSDPQEVINFILFLY